MSDLAERYKLLLITKGDLFEQEAKVARSGIGEYFSSIEIVSEKTSQAYQAILTKHQISPPQFVMVGNSLKSDILPVLEIGGVAIYIPSETTWVHELVPEEALADKDFIRLASITHVPVMLASLVEKAGV
jgi:putative hydrolase of the HAD superfamily